MQQQSEAADRPGEESEGASKEANQRRRSQLRIVGHSGAFWSWKDRRLSLDKRWPWIILSNCEFHQKDNMIHGCDYPCVFGVRWMTCATVFVAS